MSTFMLDALAMPTACPWVNALDAMQELGMLATETDTLAEEGHGQIEGSEEGAALLVAVERKTDEATPVHEARIGDGYGSATYRPRPDAKGSSQWPSEPAVPRPILPIWTMGVTGTSSSRPGGPTAPRLPSAPLMRPPINQQILYQHAHRK